MLPDAFALPDSTLKEALEFATKIAVINDHGEFSKQRYFTRERYIMNSLIDWLCKEYGTILTAGDKEACNKALADIINTEANWIETVT